MSTRAVVLITGLLIILGIAFAFWQPKSVVQAANKQLVQNVFAAIDAHNLDQLGEFLAEDMTCQMVGVPDSMDKAATIGFIEGAYAIFPDFTHELHEILAEGDRVMVRLTNHTTHRNEFNGLAPTGNRIQYASAHMLTIEAGLIKEWWLLDDNLDFMTQLGMELVPAGAGD